MDIDGKSYIKFFEVTRGFENTVVVIQDEFGYVFGAYTTESWKLSYRFYGNGAERLFTFKDTDYPKTYHWDGDWQGPGSGQHQFSDDKSIGIAGDNNGNFGLFLANDFDHGSSKASSMYNNEQLSKNMMFEVKKMEVWAIYE
jgi:hypothetical protein